MANRYFVNIEPIEPSGVVLTIEALPRLLIFGESPERRCAALTKRSSSRCATPCTVSIGSTSSSCQAVNCQRTGT